MRARGGLVDALSSALDHGGHGLNNAPSLLRRLLIEEGWREFETARGEIVRYSKFVDFVTTPPLKGLGTNVDLVRRIITSDSEALELFRNAMKEKPGPKSRDNVTRTETGNSRGYTLQRLRKDAPELHAEVLADRLSAHAAMVKAGFRPKTISVPVGRPESIAEKLRKHLAPEDLATLIRLLDGS